MSSNRKNTFYIASIEETNVSQEKHEAAIEEFFNKKNAKPVKDDKPINNPSRSNYRPVVEPTPQKEVVKDNYDVVDNYNTTTDVLGNEESKKHGEYFVSPILGRREMVESNTTATNQRSGTKRYDSYRKKELPKPEEVKEKYGRNYNEYGVYDTDQYLEILETGRVSERKPRPVKKTEPIVEEFDDEVEQVVKVEKIVEERIYAEEIVEEPEVEVKPENKNPKPVKKVSRKKFTFPPLSILRKESIKTAQSDDWAKAQAAAINQTFIDFSYGAEVAGWIQGPSVTQFLISIKPGTNVNKIRSFEKDLLMKLAANNIRIQDPIPGKSYAGIEIPNATRSSVFLGNLINNPKFLNDKHNLYVALGLDIGGDEIYVDIEKMPHGLIAGTTGSGKSVCLNAVIVSLLYRNTPEQLRLILIDPKMVEFSCYDEIPHLALPVITDPKRASAALRWATVEMDKRFGIFKSVHARNIGAYNDYIEENGGQIMPSIVIIIDELADLMSVAASEVEGNIQRLAAKARAAGIHLLVATQRPSTDIIRGSIKNNIPVRAAFRVASYTDSNTIIDHSGAEKLLGNGDMLYVDTTGERRLQGAYVSDAEVMKVTNFLRDQGPVNYLIDETELDDKTAGFVVDSTDEGDELFDEIALYAVRNKVASINRIMQVFNISFNRANRLFTQFEELGIVSGTTKGKQREILVNEDQLKDILNS